MMATSAPKAPRYSFGPFELDTAEARLYRNGVRVPLQDLPYRLLALLVEHAGDVLTREELQRHLWPANTFVEFDNSLGVAVRKVRDALHDSAEEPRYLETIPKRGYRFLGRVENLGLAPPQIQSQPEAVPARVAEVEPHVVAPAVRLFHPVYWILIGMVVFSAGVAFYVFRGKPKSSSAVLSSAQPVRVRRSIALLGFRNLRGRPEDNWLSAAFSEMLSTELAAGGELRMVSGEDVSRARIEVPLKDEDTLAKATLRRLRADPGADLVVLGSYTPLPGNGPERIRLDLRVQDTNTGETAAEDSVMGDEDELFQLVSDAGVRLRSALGVSSLTAQGTAGVRISLPSNRSALRWYTAGQARLWEFDFAGARDLLLKAIAAEPDYSPAHAALAEAWSRLGYGAKALREAQKAVDLSQQLPEEERFIIQGQYLEVSSQWPRAVGTYTVLFRRFPDSLEYGLRLASAQRHVNSADALKTLAALRNLPPPIGTDPRIDMAEASTLVNEDLVRAHAAIEKAIAKGTAQGSHLLVARAYGIMCQLSSVSQTITVAEVTNACESARRSYAAAGDRDNEARTLNDFAGLSFREGDLVHADALWREAAAEFRQVDDIEGLAASSNNLADVSILEGDLGNGKKFLQQALPNYQALGDKDGVARVLNDLGVILLESGDLRAAETKFQQAKGKADEINDSDVHADAGFGMGDVALAHGDLPSARTAYQNALTLRNTIGEKQAIAETELAIARLTLEEGHAAEAEATARRCRDQFRQEQQKDDELDAAAVLVRALLVQQKTEEARKELAEEAALTETSHNLSLRLQYRLVTAQAESATKQFDNARTLLNAVLREAKAHNLTQPQYEAQLALAEVDKLSGHTAVANEQFAKLEKSAHAEGYELIARKASAGRT
jgi:DNA-binding winged helix-turn-helix (wHTH) protein/TolB-like protein